MTVSNGGEHGSALLSVDYFKSLGTTKYNSWDCASIRLNSVYSIFNGRIKIGENISYDIREGNWGVFVTGGTASFSNTGITTL